MEKPACVIDNGTGYTKMGYAGNSEPSYIIPTCIAVGDDRSTSMTKKGKIDDLDFYIGDDALAQKQYSVSYPVRHGQVIVPASVLNLIGCQYRNSTKGVSCLSSKNSSVASRRI